MHFPHRSTRNIATQLPSVYSTFSTNRSLSIKIPSPKIHDEKELVPVERSASPSAKQILLGQEGLEVLVQIIPAADVATKPLPRLPNSKWGQMSVKQRMLAILCLQLLIVLVVGCSLLSAKSKVPRNVQLPEETVAAAASSIPSPTPSNATIKRGTFTFFIGNPQQQDSACLAQNNESAAWSCLPRRYLRMNLLPSLENPTDVLASIEPVVENPTTWYGLVGPNIDPVLLSLAVDAAAPKLGMAYHFRTTYNRAVVLKEDQMAAPGQSLGLEETSFTQVQIGDRPWLCTFNQTVIEGYIYVSHNSSMGNQNMTLDDQTRNLPYPFKLTEQRDSNSPQPYCRRMEMLGNGQLVPSNEDGELKRLKLAETVFGGASMQRAGRRRQTTSERSCRCQWMYQ
ncbi:hypothetical protein P154DRAFT_427467 [Amniculicola lignicola CBS 123094]|uniref:DUF7820 domain-containing protein n=1 Tax=Amniculicola lignicola CBS 123094 TaxID=1392246 RepID=A0A6A5WUZ1_9PLEO|nr:hypothetical protein P154DRAFT_427467 [Amniculicola lignicola CBS 123094]